MNDPTILDANGRPAREAEPTAEPGTTLNRAQRRRTAAALRKKKQPRFKATPRAEQLCPRDLPGVMEWTKTEGERLMHASEEMLLRLPSDVRIEARRVMTAMSIALWLGYLDAYLPPGEERERVISLRGKRLGRVRSEEPAQRLELHRAAS